MFKSWCGFKHWNNILVMSETSYICLFVHSLSAPCRWFDVAVRKRSCYAWCDNGLGTTVPMQSSLSSSWHGRASQGLLVINFIKRSLRRSPNMAIPPVAVVASMRSEWGKMLCLSPTDFHIFTMLLEWHLLDMGILSMYCNFLYSLT